MKNHWIFCCNAFCRDREVDELLRTLGDAAIMRQRDNITVGNDRYRFFININENLDRIRGLIIDDYRTCDKYILNNEARDYMAVYVGR